MSMPINYAPNVPGGNAPAPAINNYAPQNNTQTSPNVNPLANMLNDPRMTARALQKLQQEESDSSNSTNVDTSKLNGLYDTTNMPLNYMNQHLNYDFSNLDDNQLKSLPLSLKGAINLSNIYTDKRNPSNFFVTENSITQYFKDQLSTLMTKLDPKKYNIDSEKLKSLSDLIKNDNFNTLPVEYLLNKLIPKLFEPSKNISNLNRAYFNLDEKQADYITAQGITLESIQIFNKYGPMSSYRNSGDPNEILGNYSALAGTTDQLMKSIVEKMGGKKNSDLANPLNYTGPSLNLPSAK